MGTLTFDELAELGELVTPEKLRVIERAAQFAINERSAYMEFPTHVLALCQAYKILINRHKQD